MDNLNNDTKFKFFNPWLLPILKNAAQKSNPCCIWNLSTSNYAVPNFK